jgi:hypothetical protein
MITPGFRRIGGRAVGANPVAELIRLAFELATVVLLFGKL